MSSDNRQVVTLRPNRDGDPSRKNGEEHARDPHGSAAPVRQPAAPAPCRAATTCCSLQAVQLKDVGPRVSHIRPLDREEIKCMVWEMYEATLN